MVFPVQVFDFTGLDSPFDFTAAAWSDLSNCPKYELRYGDDEIGSDDIVGLVGYTVNSYVSQGERNLSQNIMFLAILARVGGLTAPVIDRQGLARIKEFASNGGDLTVHPWAAAFGNGKKGKGKGKAANVSVTSARSAAKNPARKGADTRNNT